MASEQLEPVQDDFRFVTPDAIASDDRAERDARRFVIPMRMWREPHRAWEIVMTLEELRLLKECIRIGLRDAEEKFNAMRAEPEVSK